MTSARNLIALVLLCLPALATAEDYRNIKAGDRIAIAAVQDLRSLDRAIYTDSDTFLRRGIKDVKMLMSSEVSSGFLSSLQVPNGTVATVEKVNRYWISSPNAGPEILAINIVVNLDGSRYLITQRTSFSFDLRSSREANEEAISQGFAKISEFPNISRVP